MFDRPPTRSGTGKSDEDVIPEPTQKPAEPVHKVPEPVQKARPGS